MFFKSANEMKNIMLHHNTNLTPTTAGPRQQLEDTAWASSALLFPCMVGRERWTFGLLKLPEKEREREQNK